MNVMRTSIHLFAAAFILCASAAHAQTPIASTVRVISSDAKAEARWRFDRGLKLYNQADYRGALIEFLRAHELTQHPIVQFNVGLVHAKLDNSVECVKALKPLVVAADAPSGSQKVRNGVFGVRLPSVRLGARQILDIAISVIVLSVVLVVWLRPEVVNLGAWGYAGAFVLSGLSTATILLPTPGIAALLVMADGYDPYILGVVTGIGGTAGSLTAYWAGTRGQRIIKSGRLHRVLCSWMDRFGGFILFFFSVAVFLPADLGSIAAGATKYPLPKYLLFVGLGNVLKMVAIFYVATHFLGPIRGWF